MAQLKLASQAAEASAQYQTTASAEFSGSAESVLGCIPRGLHWISAEGAPAANRES